MLAAIDSDLVFSVALWILLYKAVTIIAEVIVYFAFGWEPKR